MCLCLSAKGKHVLFSTPRLSSACTGCIPEAVMSLSTLFCYIMDYITTLSFRGSDLCQTVWGGQTRFYRMKELDLGESLAIVVVVKFVCTFFIFN